MHYLLLSSPFSPGGLPNHYYTIYVLYHSTYLSGILLNLCLQVQEGVHGLHQSEQMVVAVDLG